MGVWGGSMSDTLQDFALLNTIESQIEELKRRQWWTSVPLTTFSASWLLNGEQRLDGGYYANNTFTAKLILSKGEYQCKALYELSEGIDYPNRFKRVYATSKEAGTPFLTASAALHFRPISDKLLAKSSSNYDECIIDKGTLLLTRSGTVGRPTIVTEYLSKFALSDDLIRVKTAKMKTGYLYAYLLSWVGQTLITKDQYGSAIKHLEPHHIGNIPVPLIDDDDQKAIHDKVIKAFNLRDEANTLLDEADTLLHNLFGLPRFDESLIEYYSPHSYSDSLTPTPKSFVLKATELDDRLDGSYHVPIARTAIKLVKQAKYKPVQLAQIIDDVFLPPRFKRTYVGQNYGVPFLQGSHLPQMCPHDLKYISHNVNKKQVKQCLIKSGWILLTRSGTIGRIGLVPSTMKNWAASEHMIRIVAQENTSHPGYIAAFLSTPYGQHQLTSKIYGAVVDELTEADTEAVWIPNAPYEIQKQIGDKVVEAYEKKEQANQIETEAIQQLEKILEKQP